ncbi:GGDEF domain-containing protein [Kineosporia succinea]|uniref:Diguanylate cyclase (GGDEF)-like protein n=1 Tax=Kineosporia succinea TaxID=84632 RepID=A0ABT9PCQ8_9ACTN|nr:GGDEF domain-containing protein [Kineosporia succinea]MDP9830281.1 diguanylate cyclase (GGDEF)-like protein [Kineosporia succinea]
MRACGVLAVLAVPLTLLPRAGTPGATAAYLTSVAVSGLFLVTAVRALPGGRRGPWWWLVPPLGLAAVGECWLRTSSPWPPDAWPTPADAFFLAAYVPLVVAVGRLDRQRGARPASGGVLDSLVVSAAGLALFVVFMIIPVLTAPDTSTAARIAGTLYPLADATLLYLILRHLLTTGTRTPSMTWLVTGLVCVLLGDTEQNVEADQLGNVSYPAWVNILWLCSYVCYGLAAYQAARDEPAPAPAGPGGTRFGRLGLLTLSAGLPTVLAVGLGGQLDRGTRVQLGICSVVVLALLLARVGDLLRELRTTSAELAVLARTDPLTRLANRRTWDLELARHRSRLLEGDVLLVALLDLDHFKAYNDMYGHQAGDDLLREAADAWRAGTGADGVLARWGGEEFAALVVTRDEASGRECLEALRRNVPRGQTCSAGVARWDGTESTQDLLRRADEALYRAKASGRDRTELADQLPARSPVPSPRASPARRPGSAADRGEGADQEPEKVSAGTWRLRAAGVVAGVCVLANLSPGPSGAGRGGLYVLSITVSVAFALLAVRKVPADRRHPFVLTAWACVTWLAGTVLFGIYQYRWPDTFPTPGDALLIAGYLPLILGVWRLDQGRRNAFGGLLDVAIVTASAGVLSFVFIVLPQVSQTDLSVGARVVGSAYPLFDVLLLFLVVKVLLLPGRRSRALWWLIAAVVSTMSADVIQNVVVLNGGNAYPRPAYVLWGLFYVLLGVSALQTSRQPGGHRANETVGVTDASGLAGLTVARLLVLAFAALLPAVLMVALDVGSTRRQAFFMGIGSLVVTVMVAARIWDLLRVLDQQVAELARTARNDPLTGLANRRSWDLELARLMDVPDEPVLLVGLLDLDHFKKYNDTHGHQGGDDLLREAARAWSLGIGPQGRIARWGGEEFAVALRCATVEEGVARLDGLRALVPFGETCSVGIARWDGTEPADDLLRRADEALYRAKASGRDRSVLSGRPAGVTTV